MQRILSVHVYFWLVTFADAGTSSCARFMVSTDSLPEEASYCSTCIPDEQRPKMCSDRDLEQGWCKKRCASLCRCKQPGWSCTCACNSLPVKSQPNVPKMIHFMGSEFAYADWIRLKEDINCVAVNGLWTKQPTATTNRFPRTFPAQAPCGMWFKDEGCPQILVGFTLDYSWQESTSCRLKLRPFERSKMCQLLQVPSGRGVTGVHFAGDSMAAAFEFSFKNMLKRDENITTAYYSSERGCMIPHLLCPKQPDGWVLKSRVTRNDRNLFLTDLNRSAHVHVLRDTSANFLEDQALTVEFVDHPPALLVLNRGAHFEPTSKVIRDLNGTLNFVFCQSPNTSAVFRATVSGSEDPTADFFRNPDVKVNNTWGRKGVSCHYHEFEEQNDQVRTFLAIAFPQVIFLDVAASGALRKDGHRDNLHYCIPGPVDQWVIFLYNVLLAVREAGQTNEMPQGSVALGGAKSQWS